MHATKVNCRSSRSNHHLILVPAPFSSAVAIVLLAAPSRGGAGPYAVDQTLDRPFGISSFASLRCSFARSLTTF
jgi:hypothetical protein